MSSDTDAFFKDASARLRRAYLALLGSEGADEATAEAIAWAWENLDFVMSLSNPVGYLYRVGRSRVRPRGPVALPSEQSVGLPDVEPALIPALQRLPDRQRHAIWLVVACGWPYQEAADALEISKSAINTHVRRGLETLRRDIGVEERA